MTTGKTKKHSALLNEIYLTECLYWIKFCIYCILSLDKTFRSYQTVILCGCGYSKENTHATVGNIYTSGALFRILLTEWRHGWIEHWMMNMLIVGSWYAVSNKLFNLSKLHLSKSVIYAKRKMFFYTLKVYYYPRLFLNIFFIFIYNENCEITSE